MRLRVIIKNGFCLKANEISTPYSTKLLSYVKRFFRIFYYSSLPFSLYLFDHTHTFACRISGSNFFSRKSYATICNQQRFNRHCTKPHTICGTREMDETYKQNIVFGHNYNDLLTRYSYGTNDNIFYTRCSGSWRRKSQL